MMKRILASVAAAVALFAGVTFARSTGPTGVLHDLVRAQPERALAARISMESEYSACTVDPIYADSIVKRERCGTLNEAPPALVRLADSTNSLHPDTLLASALAATLWPGRDEGSLQAAIDRLRDARGLTSNQVPLLVALSAASLTHAERTQDVQYVMWALDHAMEALEHEPRNLLALFNAALAAQALYLRDGGDALWADYLAIDSTSEWAEEARRRRDELRASTAPPRLPGVLSAPERVVAFAARHPQQARELGWDVVLGDWGRAVQGGKLARADTLLAFAERLGKALQADSGDLSLADAVAAIRVVRGDRAETAKLAESHRAYAAGRRLFDIGKTAEAADSFAASVSRNPASPTLRAWTSVEHAAALVFDRQYNKAAPVLRSLVVQVDTVRHPALSARLHWVRAGTLPVSAPEYYRRAAGTYARLGEWEYYGGVRYRDAWAEYREGNTTKSYQSTGDALRALQPHRASPHLHRTLLQAAELAVRDGVRRAAKLIQEEDNAVAMRTQSPVIRVEALLAHARMLALSDSNEQAHRALADAMALFPQLPDTAQSKYQRNALRYSRTLLTSTGQSHAAQLDSAASHFSATGELAWLVTILSRRADVRLEAGDLRGADEDLDSLTSKLQRTSPRGTDVSLHAAAVERMRGSYDRLVMGYLRAKQPLHALRALERGRVSFAPDSGANKHADGWAALNPRQAVLEYALIGDTLLVWVVRRDSITVREQRVNRGELLRTIARVNMALESRTRAGADAELRQLYDMLIRPVADRFPRGGPGETELVIVADGEIGRLPFNALTAPNGRYLLDDHVIRVAASLADAPATGSRGPVDGPALLVADPSFDRYENATLDPLPGAVTEIASLRRTYPGAMELDGKSATVAAFREQAGRARVIHYAGHAVFDDRRPDRSYLLLADSGTTGRLTADSVDSMQLKGVRLVVLSACRTLRGGQGRSGGFAGLSGALLSAGAEGVVGSLWQVNDSLVQPLMVEFHRAYAEDRDPARALRSAQLWMIRSGSPELSSPTAWAGFRYMGR